MKTKKFFLTALSFASLFLLAGCNKQTTTSTKATSEITNTGVYTTGSDETTTVTQKATTVSTIDTTELDNSTIAITCESGTADAYTITDSTITFSGITEQSVYSISGEWNGNIIIDVTEDYKFELDLTGFTLASSDACPLDIESGDKVTISAKLDTENYIYDYREAQTDDDAISSALYAQCDLDIQGKGSLTVVSTYNNGIHTKDDLDIKNLTLTVESVDNALKGNDSVTIESGTLTLIATQGDGIKTSNSDISSKGNQRGTIAINGGEINIYAACDGIDASYNVEIDESVAPVYLNIYTDKYSSYSEEVTAVSDEYYLKTASNNYSFSVLLVNSSTSATKMVNATYSSSSTSGGGGGFGGRPGSSTTYYYYTFETASGYDKMYVYAYSSGQTQGSEDTYYSKSNLITINTSYDTCALNIGSSSISTSWTNYTTTSQGGMGGMQEGNTDTGDYSTKGIKACNEIIISSGTIYIKAYDDAIHANNDETLENGESALGNVIIAGGYLTLYSNDDGVHADNIVQISNGLINVTNAYEGVEGQYIKVTGGTISVVTSDDGFNATTTSGEGIVISGGYVYVYAKGDGLDSNSQTSYDGILFEGGTVVTICTSSSNSSIDTEKGYKYTGGQIIGICLSGGMSSEAYYCNNFSNVGVKSTLSLSTSKLLQVTVSSEVVAVVKAPTSINALVVYLGSCKASMTTVSSSDVTLDSNGVYWK